MKDKLTTAIFFNHCFDKRRFQNFIYWFFKKSHSGQSRLLKFLEKLKFLGFHSATQAGFSMSIDDLKIPSSKSEILLTAEDIVLNADIQLISGNLTIIERYQRIIEIWNRTSEELKYQVLQSFKISDFLNPVYLMAFSGARGNISQIRQLVGMRGLMADPQGQIIDFPIRSNFREGLTLTEYLISCSGARKGIVDTALRTAASGYLTRRLVDVAHHVIVNQIDCQSSLGTFDRQLSSSPQRTPGGLKFVGGEDGNTIVPPNFVGGIHSISKKSSIQSAEPNSQFGIWIDDLYDQQKKILSLQQRLVGRVLAETILASRSDVTANSLDKGCVLIIGQKNHEISKITSQKICKYRKKVLIRSPLTCQSSKFICQLCYGWNLAEGQLVSVGEAVGVLAAQSIGEPGTQMTMRTFHTGGVFTGILMDQTYAPFSGIVHYNFPCQGLLIRTLQGKIAYLSKNNGILSIFKLGVFAEANHPPRVTRDLGRSIGTPSSKPPRSSAKIRDSQSGRRASPPVQNQFSSSSFYFILKKLRGKYHSSYQNFNEYCLKLQKNKEVLSNLRNQPQIEDDALRLPFKGHQQQGRSVPHLEFAQRTQSTDLRAHRPRLAQGSLRRQLTQYNFQLKGMIFFNPIDGQEPHASIVGGWSQGQAQLTYLQKRIKKKNKIRNIHSLQITNKIYRQTGRAECSPNIVWKIDHLKSKSRTGLTIEPKTGFAARPRTRFAPRTRSASAQVPFWNTPLKSPKQIQFIFQNFSILYVRQNENVLKKQLIAELPFFENETSLENEQEILSNESGEIYFEDLQYLEKTISDIKNEIQFKKSFVQDLGGFWILFGRCFQHSLMMGEANAIFFKKLDLIDPNVPFSQIQIQSHNVLNNKIDGLFCKNNFLQLEQIFLSSFLREIKTNREFIDKQRITLKPSANGGRGHGDASRPILGREALLSPRARWGQGLKACHWHAQSADPPHWGRAFRPEGRFDRQAHGEALRQGAVSDGHFQSTSLPGTSGVPWPSPFQPLREDSFPAQCHEEEYTLILKRYSQTFQINLIFFKKLGYFQIANIPSQRILPSGASPMLNPFWEAGPLAFSEIYQPSHRPSLCVPPLRGKRCYSSASPVRRFADSSADGVVTPLGNRQRSELALGRSVRIGMTKKDNPKRKKSKDSVFMAPNKNLNFIQIVNGIEPILLQRQAQFGTKYIDKNRIFWNLHTNSMKNEERSFETWMIGLQGQSKYINEYSDFRNQFIKISIRHFQMNFLKQNLFCFKFKGLGVPQYIQRPKSQFIFNNIFSSLNFHKQKRNFFLSDTCRIGPKSKKIFCEWPNAHFIQKYKEIYRQYYVYPNYDQVILKNKNRFNRTFLPKFKNLFLNINSEATCILCVNRQGIFQSFGQKVLKNPATPVQALALWGARAGGAPPSGAKARKACQRPKDFQSKALRSPAAHPLGAGGPRGRAPTAVRWKLVGLRPHRHLAVWLGFLAQNKKIGERDKFQAVASEKEFKKLPLTLFKSSIPSKLALAGNQSAASPKRDGPHISAEGLPLYASDARQVHRNFGGPSFWIGTQISGSTTLMKQIYKMKKQNPKIPQIRQKPKSAVFLGFPRPWRRNWPAFKYTLQSPAQVLKACWGGRSGSLCEPSSSVYWGTRQALNWLVAPLGQVQSGKAERWGPIGVRDRNGPSADPDCQRASTQFYKKFHLNAIKIQFIFCNLFFKQSRLFQNLPPNWARQITNIQPKIIHWKNLSNQKYVFLLNFITYLHSAKFIEQKNLKTINNLCKTQKTWNKAMASLQWQPNDEIFRQTAKYGDNWAYRFAAKYDADIHFINKYYQSRFHYQKVNAQFLEKNLKIQYQKLAFQQTPEILMGERSEPFDYFGHNLQWKIGTLTSNGGGREHGDASRPILGREAGLSPRARGGEDTESLPNETKVTNAKNLIKNLLNIGLTTQIVTCNSNRTILRGNNQRIFQIKQYNFWKIQQRQKIIGYPKMKIGFYSFIRIFFAMDLWSPLEDRKWMNVLARKGSPDGLDLSNVGIFQIYRRPSGKEGTLGEFLTGSTNGTPRWTKVHKTARCRSKALGAYLAPQRGDPRTSSMGGKLESSPNRSSGRNDAEDWAIDQQKFPNIPPFETKSFIQGPTRGLFPTLTIFSKFFTTCRPRVIRDFSKRGHNRADRPTTINFNRALIPVFGNEGCRPKYKYVGVAPEGRREFNKHFLKTLIAQNWACRWDYTCFQFRRRIPQTFSVDGQKLILMKFVVNNKKKLARVISYFFIHKFLKIHFFLVPKHTNKKILSRIPSASPDQRVLNIPKNKRKPPMDMKEPVEMNLTKFPGKGSACTASQQGQSHYSKIYLKCDTEERQTGLGSWAPRPRTGLADQPTLLRREKQGKIPTVCISKFSDFVGIYRQSHQQIFHEKFKKNFQNIHLNWNDVGIQCTNLLELGPPGANELGAGRLLDDSCIPWTFFGDWTIILEKRPFRVPTYFKPFSLIENNLNKCAVLKNKGPSLRHSLFASPNRTVQANLKNPVLPPLGPSCTMYPSINKNLRGYLNLSTLPNSTTDENQGFAEGDAANETYQQQGLEISPNIPTVSALGSSNRPGKYAEKYTDSLTEKYFFDKILPRSLIRSELGFLKTPKSSFYNQVDSLKLQKGILDNYFNSYLLIVQNFTLLKNFRKRYFQSLPKKPLMNLAKAMNSDKIEIELISEYIKQIIVQKNKLQEDIIRKYTDELGSRKPDGAARAFDRRNIPKNWNTTDDLFWRPLGQLTTKFNNWSQGNRDSRIVPEDQRGEQKPDGVTAFGFAEGSLSQNPLNIQDIFEFSNNLYDFYIEYISKKSSRFKLGLAARFHRKNLHKINMKTWFNSLQNLKTYSSRYLKSQIISRSSVSNEAGGESMGSTMKKPLDWPFGTSFSQGLGGPSSRCELVGFQTPSLRYPKYLSVEGHAAFRVVLALLQDQGQVFTPFNKGVLGGLPLSPTGRSAEGRAHGDPRPRSGKAERSLDKRTGRDDQPIRPTFRVPRVTPLGVPPEVERTATLVPVRGKPSARGPRGKDLWTDGPWASAKTENAINKKQYCFVFKFNHKNLDNFYSIDLKIQSFSSQQNRKFFRIPRLGFKLAWKSTLPMTADPTSSKYTENGEVREATAPARPPLGPSGCRSGHKLSALGHSPRSQRPIPTTFNFKTYKIFQNLLSIYLNSQKPFVGYLESRHDERTFSPGRTANLDYTPFQENILEFKLLKKQNQLRSSHRAFRSNETIDRNQLNNLLNFISLTLETEYWNNFSLPNPLKYSIPLLDRNFEIFLVSIVPIRHERLRAVLKPEGVNQKYQGLGPKTTSNSSMAASNKVDGRTSPTKNFYFLQKSYSATFGNNLKIIHNQTHSLKIHMSRTKRLNFLTQEYLTNYSKYFYPTQSSGTQAGSFRVPSLKNTNLWEVLPPRMGQAQSALPPGLGLPSPYQAQTPNQLGYLQCEKNQTNNMNFQIIKKCFPNSSEIQVFIRFFFPVHSGEIMDPLFHQQGSQILFANVSDFFSCRHIVHYNQWNILNSNSQIIVEQKLKYFLENKFFGQIQKLNARTAMPQGIQYIQLLKKPKEPIFYKLQNKNQWSKTDAQPEHFVSERHAQFQCIKFPRKNKVYKYKSDWNEEYPPRTRMGQAQSALQPQLGLPGLKAASGAAGSGADGEASPQAASATLPPRLNEIYQPIGTLALGVVHSKHPSGGAPRRPFKKQFCISQKIFYFYKFSQSFHSQTLSTTIGNQNGASPVRYFTQRSGFAAGMVKHSRTLIFRPESHSTVEQPSGKPSRKRIILGSFIRGGLLKSKTQLNSQGGQIIAKKKHLLLFRKATTHLLNDQSILHIQHGDMILKNHPLCSVFYNQSKTGDIVQGIPKIEEIFEARKKSKYSLHELPIFSKDFLFLKKSLSNIYEAFKNLLLIIFNEFIVDKVYISRINILKLSFDK